MTLELLKKRCSVRDFSDKQISESIINDILEAGRLAPSGGNEQPWKFGVITDKSVISLIANAAYKQKWINTAPLLIVLCCTIIPDERNARDIQIKRFPKWKKEIEEMSKELYSCLNIEEHQTKIPGTQMCLQALEYGIYSTWISLFDVMEVADILGLPNLCIPSEILAFGYPAKNTVARPKKDMESLIFYNAYKK